jgi:hypothetical protein
MERGVPAIGQQLPVDELWDGLAADYRRDDRRRLIALPDQGPTGFVEGIRSFFELGVGQPTFSVPRVLAIRGERLALTHVRIEYPGGESMEWLTLVQLAADLQRLEIEVDFDLEDEAAALAELDLMHAALS